MNVHLINQDLAPTHWNQTYHFNTCSLQEEVLIDWSKSECSCLEITLEYKSISNIIMYSVFFCTLLTLAIKEKIFSEVLSPLNRVLLADVGEEDIFNVLLFPVH